MCGNFFVRCIKATEDAVVINTLWLWHQKQPIHQSSPFELNTEFLTLTFNSVSKLVALIVTVLVNPAVIAQHSYH